MRKCIIITGLLIASLTLVFCNAAFANRGVCSTESAKKGEVINDTCPVIGGKVEKNTPYKTEYKGKTIGFCCPACVEKFKADPAKYMAKLKKGKKCMIKCPKCGAEINVRKECKKQGCPIMDEKRHKGRMH